MDPHIAPVALDKASRLINHGPTVLVSARSGGVDNVMAAAWACALDFAPPKLTVVLDKIARTRVLVEQSGIFVIQVPTAAQLELTRAAAPGAWPPSRTSWSASASSCSRSPVMISPSSRGARPGWRAGWFPSRISSRPTTCSSARSSPPGPIRGCSATAAGTSRPPDQNGAACTTSPAAISTPSAKP